ncbi:MAG: HAD-IB family hydrolase [Candidatus Jorgensenbacteria bacterium]|nr:HAD-IB family hydrolase [Candidatus Jorgensenbacteria bacterium]
MEKEKKQRVAIFDIDGTIFRSSLIIELIDALIQAGIFKRSVTKVYAKEYRAWLDRRGTYEDYIEAVVRGYMANLKGVSHFEFLKICKEVAEFHKDRVYRYTRDLVRGLEKKNYFLLAISNSPKEIVEEFCKKLGFNKVYGRMYETDSNNKFTGKILYLDIIRDKAKVLKRAVLKDNLTLRGSIGVGDTESDVAFLKLVERPICFNPNRKLYDYAKRRGWEIVVERKDMIYELK